MRMSAPSRPTSRTRGPPSAPDIARAKKIPRRDASANSRETDIRLNISRHFAPLDSLETRAYSRKRIGIVRSRFAYLQGVAHGGHMKRTGALAGVAVFALALGLCAPAAGATAKKARTRKKPVATTAAAAETYCPPIDGAELVGPAGQSGILARMMKKMESATRGDGFAN